MLGPFLIIFPHTVSLEIPAMSVSHTILSLCLAGYLASSTKSVPFVMNCSSVIKLWNDHFSSTTAMRLFDLGFALYNPWKVANTYRASFLMLPLYHHLWFYLVWSFGKYVLNLFLPSNNEDNVPGFLQVWHGEHQKECLNTFLWILWTFNTDHCLVSSPFWDLNPFLLETSWKDSLETMAKRFMMRCKGSQSRSWLLHLMYYLIPYEKDKVCKV